MVVREGGGGGGAIVRRWNYLGKVENTLARP